MTDNLSKFRHDVYHCGALFHRAMAKYFADLNNNAPAAEMAVTARAARETGAAYNAALVALLKQLKSLPDNTEVSREAERAERTISILSFEIQRL